MPITTFKFDEKTEARIEAIKAAYPGSSKSDVLRLAIQVLEMARQGQASNAYDLAFVDKEVDAPGVRRYLLPLDTDDVPPAPRSRARKSQAKGE